MNQDGLVRNREIDEQLIHQPMDKTEGGSQQIPSDLPVVSKILTTTVNEKFYKSSELDQQPFPLIDIFPTYPPLAQTDNLSGWVRLLIHLDEDGNVIHLTVLESDPTEIFDEAALSAFRITQFSPGIRQGNRVKSRLVVKVNFDSQSIGPK